MIVRFFLLALLGAFLLAPASGQERYPPESAEYQAFTAAGKALADEDFYLREDFWKGILTGREGRAIRLQFFKRNHYQLFLGVAPEALPPGGYLDLRIFDSNNEEIAKIIGEPDKAAVSLEFENNLRTDLYLILLRVGFPPGPFPDTEIPTALFYGWK